jgi:aspartyl-tRNA(Asn)/glutamyl-tRNA(Gln) amidotransferase subunit A
MADLPDLSVAALAEAYASGAASPVDAARAVLDRIDRWEPAIRAVTHRDDGEALRAATESAARWRAGTPLGELDGVPVTVKENIATRGVPVVLGSAAIAPVPAAADAPAPARLREAGAVLVAKTTMPDFGMLTSGVSSAHPTTRNAWDPDWNPGGSSAGAGAAATAGYGPLHIGTDIGGSVRLPAAWCGVVGFKGSFGRVPVDPPYYARVIGPLTRTVDDAARAMAVLAQPDGRDHLSLPPAPELDWHARVAVSGLRIGLCLDAGAGLEVEPETRAAVAGCATALGEAGAIVDDAGPLIDEEMLAGLDRFWRMRCHLDLRKAGPEAASRALPYIQEWAAPAADYDGAAVFHGFSQMEAMARAVGGVFGEDLDLLVCPVAPVAAMAAEAPSPTGDPATAMAHIAFTVPFSMSGHPAISVPWAVAPDGRPLGVQVVGRRFADAAVLGAARVLEELRGPLPAWPAPPAG